MNRKVMIIGAGAAGMTASIFASRKGDDVFIFEKNNKLGIKLGITGKGRCNITNNCDVDTVIKNTPTNGKFMYSALNAFPPSEVMRFFNSLGIELKTERGNRVFPVSDNAKDVVEALTEGAKKARVGIISERIKDIVIENGKVRGIKVSRGSVYECDKVIIATGGMSYPMTGSTGDGYRFAKKAGHTIVPLRPSLVPLETTERFGYDSDGLLLKNIALNVRDTQTNKIIYDDFGEIQLMRYGVSGAMALSASAHMRNMSNERYQLEIDLKPALNEEKLDARIVREISALNGAEYNKLLHKLIPKALISDFVNISGIEKNRKCSEITREERRNIVRNLKNMTFKVSGFRPIDEAIITSGGVCVNEIDPKTMQSKLVDGLYFAGEVIDVDSYTGGFNLQNAFSSAYAAAIG